MASQTNKKIWWLDKAVWVMLLVYLIGIAFVYLEGKELLLFEFINTITLLFILGILLAIAYMVASKND